MQRTIWSGFGCYSVFMISHRLDIILGFDRVLVMDEGRLVEKGPPKELIERTGGRFEHLWMAGSPTRKM